MLNLVGSIFMEYSVEELARTTGATVGEIRRWRRAGCVPPTVARGPNTRFEEVHRRYVLAVKRMRAHGTHLHAIAARLVGISEAELLALAGLAPTRSTPTSTPTPTSTSIPEALSPYRPDDARARQLWELIEICPGVSLCVRADADTEARRVAREIERVHGAHGSAR